MRALFLGHSLIARRQWSFVKKLQDMGHDIIPLIPLQWGNRTPSDEIESLDNYQLVSYKNARSIFHYQHGTRKMEALINDYDPDWILSFAEPYSECMREVLDITQDRDVKVQAFAYENKIKNFNRYPANIRKNKERIEDFDTVLAGNMSAYSTMRMFNKNTHRIPHVGIETEIFNPDADPLLDELVDYLWVGRDTPEKGLQLVKDAGIEPYIHQKFIPDEKMPSLYTSARTLLHTSIETQMWREQLGYVIAEALACGLSVVHSYYGDNVEWFRRIAYLCDVLDPRQLKQTAEIAVNNYPYHRGVEWVNDNFSNDVIAEQWIQILEEIK